MSQRAFYSLQALCGCSTVGGVGHHWKQSGIFSVAGSAAGCHREGHVEGGCKQTCFCLRAFACELGLVLWTNQSLCDGALEAVGGGSRGIAVSNSPFRLAASLRGPLSPLWVFLALFQGPQFCL